MERIPSLMHHPPSTLQKQFVVAVIIAHVVHRR